MTIEKRREPTCPWCRRGDTPVFVGGKFVHRVGAGRKLRHRAKPCGDPPTAFQPACRVDRGVKFVAKLQRPIAGNGPPAILFYNEDRSFNHLEQTPDVVRSLIEAMGPAVKMYAWCSVDESGALHVHEFAPAPEPEW